MDNIAGRIIGFIITTFVIAALYGFFVATMDFIGDQPDPVASGHHAAGTIYGLFGDVTEEVERNETHPGNGTSIAHKIASPYAATADVAALLSGRLENGLASFFHVAENKVDKTDVK